MGYGIYIRSVCDPAKDTPMTRLRVTLSASLIDSQGNRTSFDRDLTINAQDNPRFHAHEIEQAVALADVVKATEAVHGAHPAKDPATR